MSYIANRYARAVTSGNLRAQARTPGDIDVIIAAGAAARRTRGYTSLAALVFRLRVEFDRVDKRSLVQGKINLTPVLLALTHLPSLHSTREAMLTFVTAEAKRGRFTLTPLQLLGVVDRVLDVLLDPVCPTCKGVKFKTVQDTGRLSGVVCGGCLGTGVRFPSFSQDAQADEYALTSHVQDVLKRKMSRFNQRVGNLLRV